MDAWAADRWEEPGEIEADDDGFARVDLRPAENGAAGDKTVRASMDRHRIEDAVQYAALDCLETRLRRLDQPMTATAFRDDRIAIMLEWRRPRAATALHFVREPIQLLRRKRKPFTEFAESRQGWYRECGERREQCETRRVQHGGDRMAQRRPEEFRAVEIGREGVRCGRVGLLAQCKDAHRKRGTGPRLNRADHRIDPRCDGIDRPRRCKQPSGKIAGRPGAVIHQGALHSSAGRDGRSNLTCHAW